MVPRAIADGAVGGGGRLKGGRHNLAKAAPVRKERGFATRGRDRWARYPNSSSPPGPVAHLAVAHPRKNHPLLTYRA
jgi:hypothetical protein